ncbi:alpha/beta fold hydrolase [Ensifer adhaerens]|uniref:alpha/beta fold hydrolase n=1 Tax=Ensifer adhaerens TaxID=106592 RepID=UPI001CC07EF0|nr:alpha/beta fold hydrolase [Ensifer adhaerens]MBZ7927723.1 alpha/beta fold hydrolase [Ensifer adhaerens]UAX96633.1 alpha/beta fold hydrolase [Ensifer adhaerens]UAY04023.1 alpha/beta fold hydrolase [Ensifer adhaerens]UAY12009.1 alpha/beta fold hydrolase [Ensifer adhaerens]
MMIDTASATLAVQIEGDVNHPWIILSGSLASDLSMWNSQIDMLTRQRRVLRYDPAGHGQSSLPKRRLTLEAMADDVVELMDRLDIATAEFVGLSMGGMVGLGLALDHSARFRRVVCACARAVFPPPALSTWDQRRRDAERSGMANLVEGTLERWFTPDASAAMKEAAAEMIRRTSVAGYTACVDALKGLDFQRRLHECQMPVHFIAGELDLAAPMAEIAAAAAITPNSQFTTIPAAAHLANVEAADAFNEVLANFLYAKQ